MIQFLKLVFCKLIPSVMRKVYVLEKNKQINTICGGGPFACFEFSECLEPLCFQSQGRDSGDASCTSRCFLTFMLLHALGSQWYMKRNTICMFVYIQLIKVLFSKKHLVSQKIGDFSALLTFISSYFRIRKFHLVGTKRIWVQRSTCLVLMEKLHNRTEITLDITIPLVKREI